MTASIQGQPDGLRVKLGHSGLLFYRIRQMASKIYMQNIRLANSFIEKTKTLGKIVGILFLCCVTTSCASDRGYMGLAGPAIFLWSVTHPIDMIEALAKLPAEKRRLEAYRLAITQCEAEEKFLPKSIQIDSFIDEGAALRGNLIYELLLKRNVKAIYVQPQPTNDGKALRYAYPDGDYIGRFTYPAANAPTSASAKYIKLELRNEEEGNCLPANWTPLYIQDRYKKPPALPKTCIAYSFTDNPQTQYSLRYNKSQKIAGEQFGTWSIIDLLANQPVASLTTVDIPPTVSSGGPSDCRSPYTVLAWRIKPGLSRRNLFAVKESIVVASPSFLELIDQKERLPLVQATTTKTPFVKGEWEADSSNTALYARWKEAVDEAVNSGLGHYEGQGAGYSFSPDYQIYEGAHGRGRILDWGQRNLIGLQLVETGTQIRNGINWDVSASEGGFLVFTKEWRKGENPLVARYNINGSLDWAIQVSGTPEINGCGFGPRQALSTDTEILLKQPSCNNKEGTVWRLPKKEISFYKTQFVKELKPGTSAR